MRFPIACGALFLTAIPSFAAKRIQMDVTEIATNKVTSQEILIDNARLRINMGDTSVMFLTVGGSRMVMLDKKKNEYQVIDQATMDQMGQMMQSVAPQLQAAQAQMAEAMKNMPPEQRAMMEKMMKGKMPGATPAAAPVQTVFTAKGGGSANGFKCTNYVGMRGTEKVEELCASQASDLKLAVTDYQVYDKMREFTAGLMKALQNSALTSGISANFTQTGVQGFPVQTTTFSNGKAATRTDVKSVSDVSLTDADFSTGNAKKMEIAIPNMAGRGAKGK
ncbi:MAG: hypothetical protein ABI824_13780 [Acidobacteriota bacterium]